MTKRNARLHFVCTTLKHLLLAVLKNVYTRKQVRFENSHKYKVGQTIATRSAEQSISRGAETMDFVHSSADDVRELLPSEV